MRGEEALRGDEDAAEGVVAVGFCEEGVGFWVPLFEGDAFPGAGEAGGVLRPEVGGVGCECHFGGIGVSFVNLWKRSNSLDTWGISPLIFR